MSSLVSWVSRRRPYIYAVLLFLAATLVIFCGARYDKLASDWLHDSTRSIDPVLQLVTWLGDGRFLIPACLLAAGFFLARRSSRVSVPVDALSALLASGLIAHALKYAFGRPRPYLMADSRYLNMPYDSFHAFTLNHDFASFPSGHSTAVFAVAWVLFHSLPRKPARLAVLCGAILVALSRVALYKHYFADTFAGAGLGIFVAHGVMAVMGARRARAAQILLAR